ncbi:MAG: hypothetical protein U0K36_00475 [Bacteroidales bacterium]|nr:hypothetical protein [Bacteroidales bacterium]
MAQISSKRCDFCGKEYYGSACPNCGNGKTSKQETACASQPEKEYNLTDTLNGIKTAIDIVNEGIKWYNKYNKRNR